MDFEAGHSAVLEMARLVERVSGFTDLSKGRTVNVGVIAGGTRSNVVAAECRAEVDVRIARASDAASVERMFRGLRCADRACRLVVSGGINRPPMERKPGTVRLFKQARALAAEMGFVLEEAATGGGSDGNFTAALGVPTLDGMGAVGGGAHAATEHIVAKHCGGADGAAGRDDRGSLDTRFAQQAYGRGNGQAHHVEEAAFDARNPARGVALNAVRTGLVERVAGREIGLQVGFVNRVEGDVGRLEMGARAQSRRNNGNAGMHLVRSPGESCRSMASASATSVNGLVEDVFVADDGGIGAEHDGLGVQRVDSLSLFKREPRNVGRRPFASSAGLVDVGCLHCEGVTGLRQQLAAAR